MSIWGSGPARQESTDFRIKAIACSSECSSRLDASHFGESCGGYWSFPAAPHYHLDVLRPWSDSWIFCFWFTERRLELDYCCYFAFSSQVSIQLEELSFVELEPTLALSSPSAILAVLLAISFLALASPASFFSFGSSCLMRQCWVISGLLDSLGVSALL